MKVLISPEYGAGWSTWSSFPQLATDEDLIRIFEWGCTEEEMERACRVKGYVNEYGDPPYMGGFRDLVVKEIPKGTYFKIGEYDGFEYIIEFDKDTWFYAKE